MEESDIVVLTKAEEEKATLLFQKTDLNQNGLVDEEEMLQILPQVLGEFCSEESHNQILKEFREVRATPEGITCEQFISLLKHYFVGKIDEYLTTFGFDKNEKDSFLDFRRNSGSRLETMRNVHNLPVSEKEVEARRQEERAKHAINPEGIPNDVEEFKNEYGLN
eukprot:TRINITY_DN31114_c0_g1_i1.p1 TRINITY_DN31114_c0_g1~~TRINITY_DN31114_c0_g1_i1.p1  ORF type:complete len:165 (+),score=36.64 TRINITY_DN31114_c0_g1_i1:51-545(+)